MDSIAIIDVPKDTKELALIAIKTVQKDGEMMDSSANMWAMIEVKVMIGKEEMALDQREWLEDANVDIDKKVVRFTEI